MDNPLNLDNWLIDPPNPLAPPEEWARYKASVIGMGVDLTDPTVAAAFELYDALPPDVAKARDYVRDKDGQFARLAGGAPAPKVTVERVSGERAFSGKQVLTRRSLSKLQTGALGEAIIAAYLGGNVRTLNLGRNNAPIDLRAGDKLIEAKSGLVSNRPDSQKWRATIGEPGPSEKVWLRGLSAERKRAWNEGKMRAIIRRKYDAVRRVSQVLGRAFKPTTIATIINPDTRTADVYELPGFHRILRWNSPQMAAAYKGTFRYKEG